MPARPDPRIRDGIRLTLLLGAHLALSWWWTYRNGAFVRPTITEATPYRLKAAALLCALRDGGPRAWLEAAFVPRDDHTPLMAMVASLVARVAGADVTPTVMWCTLISFAVLFGVGTYRIASRLLGPRAALLVTALALSAPVVQGHQRDFLPTLPMNALLLLALDALLCSERFRRPGQSAVFGLWAGLATLAKVIAPLYLVGGAAWALCGGLRSHGRRALGNLALAGLFAASLTGPWLLLHGDAVTGYAGAVVSSNAVAHARTGLVERWTYYPSAALVWGLGLPLGLLVLACALRRLLARKPLAEGAAELWATVLASWVILTLGQTSTLAQYVLLWVPLACVLAVAGALAARTPLERRTLLVLLGLAGATNLALAQRSIQKDEGLWRLDAALAPLTRSFSDRSPLRQIALLPGTGQYLGPLLRSQGVLCRPAAEPWPVEEFASAVLADAGPRVPRVSATHPIVTGNMAYEALLRGEVIDRIELVPGKEAASMISVANLDYFVSDTLILGDDPWIPLVESWGMRVERLAARTVTPLSELRLYALRKPWSLAPFVPRSILTAPRVERREKRLARGWVCRGFLRERRDELDGLWVAHAFVLPPNDRTDAVLVLRAYDQDGAELARSWRRVKNVDPGDGLLAVSFDVLSIPRRAQWSWTLSVATEGWE